MRFLNIPSKILFALVLFAPISTVVQSQPISTDFYCEVMSVHGNATVSNLVVHKQKLNEGDLLKPGDEVIVESDSYVDLAYDRQWKNVTRIGANSTIIIRSIYPTNLDLKTGDIFARLDDLPKTTTFEIKTPVAVTAVRGSHFWTFHKDGSTEVKNFSKRSRVYVFGLDPNDNLLGDPTLLQVKQKTSILAKNKRPGAPKLMSKKELERGKQLVSSVNNRIKRIVAEGRNGKTSDIGKIKKLISQKRPIKSLKPKIPKRVAPKRDQNAERKNEDLHDPPNNTANKNSDGGGYDVY